jgi:2-dehydropantoate 2-reductase
MEKLVLAIAVGIDAVREQDRFTYAQRGKIIFGLESQKTTDDRIVRLEEILTRAAIPYEVSADILRTMWWKFMINVGVNQASAVLRAPYRVFQESADARNLMLLLMQEVVDLAKKVQINLTGKDLDEWQAILSTLGPTGKTSMLQDIEAGRKTEVEIFAGKVVSLGKEHDVPTPANNVILQIIKAMEQKNNLSI